MQTFSKVLPLVQLSIRLRAKIYLKVMFWELLCKEGRTRYHLSLEEKLLAL